MQIIPVDDQNNLYVIQDLLPQSMVDKVLSTSWESIPWQRQDGQENWLRRCIDDSKLIWFGEFEQNLSQLWNQIAQSIGREILPYQGTAWWLDEPGFTCPLHTDGEMPGSMQITWFGDADTGTTFYYYKDSSSLRFQVPVKSNCGYIMINTADNSGYRKLQWHGMPACTQHFRLTSYSWITEIK